MTLSQLLSDERRSLSREDSSSYEKTYSQLISANNFKEKAWLGSGDKTTATHEKIFTLTLFMVLRNIFCMSPCFQCWTQPPFQPSSLRPSSPAQEISLHSPLKSIFICGHFDSLTLEREGDEESSTDFLHVAGYLAHEKTRTTLSWGK